MDGDKETDGRLGLREDLSPARYSEFVHDWIDNGANFVGGCCGTTPDFIRAVSAYTRRHNATVREQNIVRERQQLNRQNARSRL